MNKSYNYAVHIIDIKTNNIFWSFYNHKHMAKQYISQVTLDNPHWLAELYELKTVYEPVETKCFKNIARSVKIGKSLGLSEEEHQS